MKDLDSLMMDGMIASFPSFCFKCAIKVHSREKFEKWVVTSVCLCDRCFKVESGNIFTWFLRFRTKYLILMNDWNNVTYLNVLSVTALL